MARLLADAAAHRGWWVPARLHAAAQRMVSSMRFRMGVVAVVVANTALMATERYPMDPAEKDLIDQLNLWFTAVYVLEACVKVFAFGPRGYWSDAYNKFDAVILALSLSHEAVLLLTDMLPDLLPASLQASTTSRRRPSAPPPPPPPPRAGWRS